MKTSLKTGLKIGPEGFPIGKDPRELTQNEWAQIDPILSKSRAIRAKCLDCCNHSALEVKRCVHVSCPLWAHRLGTTPKASREAI